MASYNPGDSLSAKTPPRGQSSHKRSEADSSPGPAQPKQRSGITEPPKEPEQIFHAFERPTPDPLAIGNPSLEFALKLKGQLGYFLNRDQVDTEPVPICINFTAFRDATQRTIRIVCERLIRLAGHIEVHDINETATSLSTIFANGIVIMTYVRLRRVNSLEVPALAKFCQRPKVPVTLPVPAPYALAISQLGIVEASSLVRSTTFIPTIPDSTTNFGLLPGITWSTAAYLQAMEYGQKIGMTFKSIDLSVPLGSSWWLHRPDYADGLFSLQCALPEDNYTEATAVLHSLFCNNAAGGHLNEIFDLSPLTTHDYGAMIRNPHADISVSSYFAIEEAPETIWKVV